MLAQFQSLYPNGSLISELVQIFQGKYIVRASVQIEGITRATGMAAAETVEAAEDQARTRALIVLGMTNAPQESVAFSSSLTLEEQPKPSLSNKDRLEEYANSSANAGDFTRSQWPAASSTEISTLPSSGQKIQPEPVTTHNVDLPTVSPRAQLTNDIPSSSTNDIYSPDFSQSIPVTANRETQFDTPVENLEINGNKEENLPLLSITASNVTPFTPRGYSLQEDTLTQTGTGRKKKKSEPVNLSDVIAKTDVQIERLGWTKEQGREYLKKTYGKLGRSLLSEEELLDFLRYLESQPDPLAGF